MDERAPATRGRVARGRAAGTGTGGVTIADVARAAGVSTATVSNVLNARSGMTAGTRSRVLAAIESLGYQPNPTARHLRAGRTDAVALVVPELNRPYFGRLATLLADGVEAGGRRLVVQRSGGRRQAEIAALEFAQLRAFDALVVCVVDLDPQDLHRLSFVSPVVLIGERPGPHGFPHVMMDNVQGARAATAHLLDGGAGFPVVVGGASAGTANLRRLRTEGFRLALAERGLPFSEQLVVPLPVLDLASGRRAVHELAAAGVPFDAVLAVTDLVALGVLRGLADLGRPVPEQVQVIGFDDVEEAAYAVPALSSVDPGVEAIAGHVLDLLGLGPGPAPASAGRPREGMGPEVVVPSRLVLRESTRPAPSRVMP